MNREVLFDDIIWGESEKRAADIARRCVEAARRVPYLRTHQLDHGTTDYGWTSAPDWYGIEQAIIAELAKDASNE